MALVAGKAIAKSTTFPLPVFNISGTLEVVKTNYTTKSGANTIQTTETESFNNAYIMGIISEAVAQGYAAGVPATNFPAKSYVAYNPLVTDSEGLQGVFYVTNKNGLSYPLSGIDTNGAYYSYAEFDSDNGGATNGFLAGFDLGLTITNVDDFNYVSAFNQSNVTNTSTSTTSSTAVLYIHDNPYAFDAADLWAFVNGYTTNICSPNPCGPSGPNYENAIEIQGIFVTKSNTNKQGINNGSGSFTGSGNALVNGSEALVLSGKATVTDVVSQNGQ